MSAMKTPLVLLTLLASATVARETCTAEQMEGLQIVGYAFNRVFRLTNYAGHCIQLEALLYTAYDVSSADIGYLVHLHQGFDRKLILLQYGMHGEVSGENGGVELKDTLSYNPEPELAVIDDASVGSKEVVRMKQSWSDCSCTREASKKFASFVYDDRVYFEGGHADIRQERPSFFKFVSNSSDLCADMKFPVVDIAVDPPTCYNRMLNETADVAAGDDEWIVSLVDGIRTTRSKTLCTQHTHLSLNFPAKDDQVNLPNHERFCYYLKKPGMKTPCLFADGGRYLFTDVQVVPAEPVRMAKKVPSTTNSPVTTDSAPEASSDQTSTEDEPKTSGSTATSKHLWIFIVVFSLDSLRF